MTDTLQAQLKGSFDKSGIKLDASIGGIGKLLDGVPLLGSLDVTKLNGAVDLLKGADFSSIEKAVEDAAGQAGGLSDNLPDAGNLLDGLTGALTKLATGIDADIGKALKEIEAAARGLAEQLRREAATATDVDVSTGAARLAQILEVVVKAASNPLLSLVLVAFTRIAKPVVSGWKVVADGAAGFSALVTSLGSLGGLDALSQQASTLSSLLAQSIDIGQIDAIVARLKAVSIDDAIVQALDSVDLTDLAKVETAAAPVLAFYADLNHLAELIDSTLGTGLRALKTVDIAGLVAGIEGHSVRLLGTGLTTVGDLAKALVAFLDPLLRFKFPTLTPGQTGAAFLSGEMVKAARTVATADPARWAKPLTDGLAAALGPIHEVRVVVERATAAIETAVRAFAKAAGSVDLAAAADTLRRALRPVSEALASVSQALSDAEAQIKSASATAIKGIDTVRNDVVDNLKPIRQALMGVGDELSALKLDQLVAALRSGVEEVASVLRAAPLKPFIDKAIEILNTGADILSAVPKGILPAAVKEQLDAACAVIQDLDFSGVTKDLGLQLDDLVATVSAEALQAINGPYQELLTFLGTINPRPFVDDFEKNSFNPLLDKIKSVDPTELLAPVAAALDEVRAQIQGFDIDHLLAPIDAVFDKLDAGFKKLDPNLLLQPLADEAKLVRDQINQALPLSDAIAAVTKADQRVGSILAKATQILPVLDAIYDGLVGGIRELACETGLLAGAVKAVLAGIAVDVPLASLGDGWRWVFGADGPAALSQRVGLLSTGLDTALGAVDGLVFDALIGDLARVHKAVLAKLSGYPVDSELRRRLDPVVAQSDPTDLFSALTANRAKFKQAFEDALGTLRRLEGAAWSEVTVVAQALRDQLRPLVPIVNRARALLDWLGADASHQGLAKAVNDLLAQFRPSVIMAPLAAELGTLGTKVAGVIDQGVAKPVLAALGDGKKLIDLIDVPIPKELEDLFVSLQTGIDDLRPRKILADVLTSLEATRTTLLTLDPLTAIKQVFAEVQTAITRLIDAVRPSVLFEPIFAVYDRILGIVQGLDVIALVRPVHDALDDIKNQLEAGLTDAGTALERLKDSCKSPGGLSVGVKVAS